MNIPVAEECSGGSGEANSAAAAEAGGAGGEDSIGGDWLCGAVKLEEREQE